MLPGVYPLKKKDGTEYFKASVTYRGQHISLGSFSTEKKASLAYERACELLNAKEGDRAAQWTIESYGKYGRRLEFSKWVVLLNFRDNGLYSHNPIYLRKRWFEYYLDRYTVLKFDADDLFYYSTHKIMRRGGHLFVSEYGLQVSILSRYGIKNYAVPGRDFNYVNGDPTDFRYGNIEIINRFHGVRLEEAQTRLHIRKKPFVARIHINGDVIVGRYATDVEAAIAYNKAADLLEAGGFDKDFPRNYIETMKESEYYEQYDKTGISTHFKRYANDVLGINIG